MKPAQCRRKGMEWQRSVAKLLAPIFGDCVHSTGAAQARARREHRPADVEGTPYWIECKRGKAVNARAALRQAAAETDGRPVVVFVHDDGAGPHKPAHEWVCMPVDVFVRVVR